MRHFGRQSIKGGRCSALNQKYKSSVSDNVFNIFSKKIDINGKICDLSDKYIEFTNKHRKIIEKEYDSQFEDSRDNDQEERNSYINNWFSKLTINE